MSAPSDRGGFTLIELLILVTIVGVLAGLMAPAVARALDVADEVACASNLRQIGLAMDMYLKDSGGRMFPLKTAGAGGTLWYYGYESFGSVGAGEGNRQLDRERGKLYPYLRSTEGVEVCPSFNYSGAYKPKYDGKWWTYGVNAELLPGSAAGGAIEAVRPRDASRTVVFADSAQVNTFQAPASPSNPLVEEWFYIQPGMRYVQFRHGGRANVLMADWHVELCEPAAGSIDPRLPSARIGYLDTKAVLHRPRPGTVGD